MEKFKYKKIKLNKLFIGKLLFIFGGITILTILAIIDSLFKEAFVFFKELLLNSL